MYDIVTFIVNLVQPGSQTGSVGSVKKLGSDLAVAEPPVATRGRRCSSEVCSNFKITSD